MPDKIAGVTAIAVRKRNKKENRKQEKDEGIKK
mgnify:CR=1 FL=1